ncbi:MAG TPA: alpha/beta hydrolase [Candidatus Binatia bacterium]|jgi:pimeloyl-ACP methyl ester carboxylesterase|nr:alpha/beta hydrolase [Candidatus Binatia bacterium]
MTDFATGNVQANGIDFHYVESGSGPLVLCLHGFPDNALTYRSLLPALAAAGFRAVAPFMRGYAPTSRPRDERYQSVLLAQDGVALISALGAEQAFVVGHDWGALATYGVAALAPEPVRKIVTLAAAHPATLLGAMATNYDMIKGGWHAYFFQMPFAEQAVAANSYEFIERWWRDASPEYDLPREIIESVKETFRQPGVVTAALNYYRHTMNPANRDPALATLQERVTTTPTPVPALAFHGTKDRPGRLAAFERMDQFFAAGLEKVILPGTGHFLHLERPAEVNAKVVEFLKA